MSTGDRNDPYPIGLPDLRQVMNVPGVRTRLARIAKARLDRSFDIPYLAGYSLDGSTIFIDRDMPEYMPWNGKPFYTDEFLRLHEELEKSLIDEIRSGSSSAMFLIRLLGFRRDPLATDADDLELYLRTHGCAETYEENSVQIRIGTDGHAAYNKFMNQHVKIAGDERIIRVPRNLDLTPYDGDPQVRKLLGEMRRAMQ